MSVDAEYGREMIESRQWNRCFGLGLSVLNPYGVLTITLVLIVFVSALPLYAQEEENSSPLLT